MVKPDGDDEEDRQRQARAEAVGGAQAGRQEGGGQEDRRQEDGRQEGRRCRGVKPAKKVSAARSKAKAEREAPEKVPGRKERRGVVVSDAMDKTIVVRIDVAQKHQRVRQGRAPLAASCTRTTSRTRPASATSCASSETRPLSATKRWRLLEILEKAK